ncbi:ferric reductase like transmembrane component-domain-containing protein [Massariosphaeria phaeospora]|uniref:Ferric reductase like transmembrane component-domain-containing protein n=1 Tax=Massariosphaeria phaeospora TaxID=100035 RepID=A0A7C8HYB9_9PLEO|nr:ferric reductase like transmembrane component-domain-containing protein [Massariosphaeria phaeospora]
MRNHLPYTLLLLGSVIQTDALRSGKWCFAGCELNLNYVTFNDTDPMLSRKIRSCQSLLRVTSLYLCVQSYCTAEGLTEWLQGTSEMCQRTANVTLPPYDVISEYTPEQIAGVKRLNAEEALTYPKLGIVVIPDESFFERGFTTLDAADYEYNIHLVYGWALYYFWAAVVGIGVGTRLIALIQGFKRQEWQPSPEGESMLNERVQRNRIPSLLYVLSKRHIITPATFGYRCSQNMGWCTVPPRIQSLTITTFVLLNVVLCSIDYRVTEGNLYWPQQYIQRWRYVSDRTGIISLANFPLIWLFGTRNNTLMWLTGWGFGTYNNFHRWVARVATVQAVVHSVGYTVMIVDPGGWHMLWKHMQRHYFWNGELATIFMCALLAFSVYGLRRSHYEIFLVTHIVFSIIVLLTMYYHVEIFNGDWNFFIWPCLVIWILDRLLRTVRILLFNPCFWNTKANAAYDPSSNLVRLDVPCSQSFLTPQPGTYYYLYVLDDLRYAHQNHPFTLAYVASDRGSHDVDDRCHSAAVQLPSIHRSASDISDTSTESEALLLSTPPPPRETSSSLVFLIRPYDGFTSRLAQRASTSPTPLRVLVEGPYGHTTPLHTFPNILFLVGGTGIAVPLSHLTRLLSSNSPSSVISLRIVWAVREHAFLASVMRDFQTLLQDERVELVVHVTQDAESKDDVLAGGVKGVEVKAGRPVVDTAVAEAVAEAGKRRLAVVACGPAQMADQARRASVRALERGCRGIEYFEESFKW